MKHNRLGIGKSVLWASKHEIGECQTSDLEKIINGRFSIYNKLIYWSSTENEAFDNESNAAKWKDLAEDFDIVCGVFPPSAIIGLFIARAMEDEGKDENLIRSGLKVYTPVSEIKFGIDGKKIFRFLRWQEI